MMYNKLLCCTAHPYLPDAQADLDQVRLARTHSQLEDTGVTRMRAKHWPAKLPHRNSLAAWQNSHSWDCRALQLPGGSGQG